MSSSKLELLNPSGQSSSPVICPEIAHYGKEAVFSWTPCYKIFIPCLWLYKVFCCVGHRLSKMFQDAHNLRKPLWILLGRHTDSPTEQDTVRADA